MTFLLEHRPPRHTVLLIRGRFGVIIRHIKGGDVTKREIRVDTGWRGGKGHERQPRSLKSLFFSFFLSSVGSCAGLRYGKLL